MELLNYSLSLISGYLKVSHKRVISLFSKLVATWVFVSACILFPLREIAWGKFAYLTNQDLSVGQSGMIFNFFGLTHNFMLPYEFSLVLIGVGFLLSIFQRISFIGSVLIFIGYHLIYSNSAPFLDGGDNLMHIMTIYVMFMCLVGLNFKNEFFFSLSRSLSKFALLMARIQVVVVYLVAGLTKISGPVWTSGTALYYTLNVDMFTHPLLKVIINSSPVLTVLMTYSVLVFQITFPFLIWLKPTKRVWIFMGSCIHIGIAFGMGLMTFGFAMTISYFVFYNDKEARLLMELMTSWKRSRYLQNQFSRYLAFGKNMIFNVLRVVSIKEGL